MEHVLITGSPGVGKTTLIREIARQLRTYEPIGFYTQEIREKGERKGFRLISFDGSERILSHVGIAGPHRVGKYGVDIAGFELFLKDIDFSRDGSNIVIIDEIGKMESFSSLFREMVNFILASDKLLIATVALKGSGIIEQVKNHPGIVIYEVTPQNRTRLASEILGRIIGNLK